jgi:phosphoglycerate dehydrogenase-like enzyme
VAKPIAYVGAKEGYEALIVEANSKAETVHVKAEARAVAEVLTHAVGFLDASMKVRITDAMVDAAPYLRIISCATTGSDHIERGSLDRRAIPVRSLKEDPSLLKNLTPAAELSWALLLACARKLKVAFRHVDQGAWVREEFPGVMLNGRTLGLVGCGRIGGWMARYALAFGMRVLAYDPHNSELPDGVTPLSLMALVEESDFLSIHVHLSDETRGLLSFDVLQKCKPGMILINTSRGAIVDEAALLDALKSGRIDAAGVDVLNGEPEIDRHPLVEYARIHDNMLITPHCGGFSPDAVRLVCRHAARKILTELKNL